MALLRRAQGGDRDAAQQLFDKYSVYIRKTIRLALAQRARPLVDSDAVMQETRILLLGQILPPHVDSPEAFCRYVKVIAHRRTLKENRDHLDCAKRSRHREVALEEVVNEEEPSTETPAMTDIQEANERFRNLMKEKQQRACRMVVEAVRAGVPLPEYSRVSGVPLTLLEHWLRWGLKDEARQKELLTADSTDAHG
jgi:hypothetical protein